jgi:lipid A 3-O-deacylase
MRKLPAALGALALACAATTACAVDSVSFELGRGDNDMTMGRVGLQWRWGSRWLQTGGWHLGGYWDAQVGYWKSGAAGGNGIVDLGLTPVFRWQRDDLRGFYVEGAIGFHYLSSRRYTATTQTSTNFQFGDHIGMGYKFGDKQAWDMSVRAQHMSNGSIKRPNPGQNFLQARLQYHF